MRIIKIFFVAFFMLFGPSYGYAEAIYLGERRQEEQIEIEEPEDYQTGDEELEIPEGMEQRQIGNHTVILPEGTKVIKKGNLLTAESLSAYSARKFLEMENRFNEIEQENRSLKDEIESLRKTLEEIKKSSKKLKLKIGTHPIKK